MAKRIYFIIASIISFSFSIYSIVTANEVVKETIDGLKQVYSGFPEDFQNRVIGIYETSGAKLIIAFAILVIIASLILFIFAVNNTLLKHKGLVITLTILSVFFTNILLVQLINIASFIIILCCKRKKPEDFPEKVGKIYKLELERCRLSDYLLSILLLVAYFSQFIWSKYLPDDFTTSLMIEILFNLIMIVLCILVFYDQLRFNFKVFKANFRSYMRFIWPRLGIAYLLLFVASMISVLVTKNAVSVNQETVESLPLYYMLPAAIIYAPIVEEILFRGVIRRFIKNNILFIIVSALVFGVLHTIGESSIRDILIMSLPYSVLGAYLAYVYTKTNNIFTSITSHAIFNTISSIFSIFV